MTAPVERCDVCGEYHHPGPCYPDDDQRSREDGWRLYKAIKTQTFHNDPDSEERR